MSNPFSKAASDAIQKRDLWDKLSAARVWIAECYDPENIELQPKSDVGSGLLGYRDAMQVVSMAMGLTKPNKAQLLAWIDSRFEELLR